MNSKATTKHSLRLIKETAQARLYEKRYTNGKTVQQWVPRSVCPRTSKLGDEHEVEIENWWLAENPWQKPDGKQKDLL